MADANLVKLINGLLDKTNAGELRWAKTPASGKYRADFTNYSIEISSVMEYNEDIGEPDEEVKVCVLDKDLELIEEINYSDFDRFELASEEYPFRAFKALHSSARRSALGMDKAIASIIGELIDNEVPEETPPAKSSPKKEDSDDIPF